MCHGAMNGNRHSGWLRRIARRRDARRRGRRRQSGAGGPAVGGQTQWLGLLIVSLPGLAALGALLFTWMQVGQASKELRIAEQGQITTRFTAAITNLGAESLDVRLGGIYALERIMQDSSRDRSTVVSVLSAYVRLHAGIPVSGTEPAPEPPTGYSAPTDIQAVMNVLAHRAPGPDTGPGIDLGHADLRGLKYAITDENIYFRGAGFREADLRGSELSNADFREADLSGADLRATQMAGANLTKAFLLDANLSGAGLTEADLTDASICVMFEGQSTSECADLTGAVLELAKLPGAFLPQVKLAGAYLAGADLRGADLTGADLQNADLTAADLTDAKLDGIRLDGAKLDGVKLGGVELDEVSGQPSPSG
ncbi:hypothetical protein KNE206_42090 [Kitasatospora sp. NE20-6]|uniref:pentapeptide repeat-containing protein n=1 Tax=Kitasatospora sp. NE20-6 TaxID=2859066 RepID=UPI0034DB7FEA